LEMAMNGTGVRHKSYEAALQKARLKRAPLEAVSKLLETAHEAGDARATYALATWYLHGKHFKKNVRKSVSLLRKAASQDLPDALFDLAVCYERGEGMKSNAKKAAELYLRAALHGEMQSIYEVGRCYYYGIGVHADRDIARVWFQRAEEVGAR
jgi:TPR repeat protein